MKRILGITAAVAMTLGGQTAAAQGFAGGIPADWTCLGNCGTLPADGVVTLAPGGSPAYGYVSTADGVNNVGVLNLGDETNGSLLRSSAFSANAGDPLNFSFNYVTSDGSGYADYAWARLLNTSDLSQAALLFTARTHPTENIVPGTGMPAPDATLVPASVTVIGGGPTWSALGSSSGDCYSAGCGYSDWVNASYAFTALGEYVLEFGVVNWSDTAYDSGLAFDGITVAGNPITPVSPIPEPGTYAMLLAGLGLLGWVGRRKSAGEGSIG